jgi:hypothetical protein
VVHVFLRFGMRNDDDDDHYDYYYSHPEKYTRFLDGLKPPSNHLRRPWDSLWSALFEECIIIDIFFWIHWNQKPYVSTWTLILAILAAQRLFPHIRCVNPHFWICLVVPSFPMFFFRKIFMFDDWIPHIWWMKSSCSVVQSPFVIM